MTDPFFFLAQDKARKLLECEPGPDMVLGMEMIRDFINDWCEKWDRCTQCFGPYHEPWRACPKGNDE